MGLPQILENLIVYELGEDLIDETLLSRCTSLNILIRYIYPNLAFPHLISPHLTSPHLTSPHFTSPNLNKSKIKALINLAINVLKVCDNW